MLFWPSSLLLPLSHSGLGGVLPSHQCYDTGECSSQPVNKVNFKLVLSISGHVHHHWQILEWISHCFSVCKGYIYTINNSGKVILKVYLRLNKLLFQYITDLTTWETEANHGRKIEKLYNALLKIAASLPNEKGHHHSKLKTWPNYPWHNVGDWSAR